MDTACPTLDEELPGTGRATEVVRLDRGVRHDPSLFVGWQMVGERQCPRRDRAERQGRGDELVVEREHDPLQQLDILHVERPLRRGTQVVELQVQPGSPGELVRRPEAGAGLLAEGDVVVGVATAPIAAVAIVLETLTGVLAQRLEQLVAHRAVGLFVGDDHRLATRPSIASSTAHSSTTSSDDDRCAPPACRTMPANTARRSNTTASSVQEHEYDQSTAARSVWWRSNATAPTAGEEPEPLVEQRQDLGHAERRDPRRRELDRERDAVEATADLVDRRRVRGVDAKVVPAPRRAARRTGAPRRCARSGRRRSESASDSERSAAMCSPSTSRPSRLVARIRTPGHARRTRSTSRATGVEQVLAVVETHSSSRFAQALDDALLERRADALLHRERGRDDAEHRLGIAGRRELRQPRAVAELGQHVGRDLQREPRLADATDARQRHEPVLGDRLADTVQLCLAADERRELRRQVRRQGVERPQRREVVGEARRPRPGTPVRVARGRAGGARPGRAASIRALVAQHLGCGVATPRSGRRAPTP